MKKKYYEALIDELKNLNSRFVNIAQLLPLSSNAKQSTPELSEWQPSAQDNQDAFIVVTELMEASLDITAIPVDTLIGILTRFTN